MAQTRISRLFDRLRAERRPALIAYLTAGDPSPSATPELAAALERGGADLIELGVPFSDPIADGPVIQRGSDRALKAGTKLTTVLDIAAQIRRQSEIPLLLFTYLNPVLRFGLEPAGARRGRERYRWLPAYRRERGRGRALHSSDAPSRSRHGFSSRAHPAASAVWNWWRNTPPASSILFPERASPGCGRAFPIAPRRWSAPCAR